MTDRMIGRVAAGFNKAVRDLDRHCQIQFDAQAQSAIIQGLGCVKFIEVVPMSLSDVLPDVQLLSRLDKIRLIQFLAQQLEQDAVDLIEPGRTYPIYSPYDAYGAAAALMQALKEDQGQV